MRRFVIAAILLLMPQSTAFAVNLQYIPSIPVHYTSKLTIEIQESLPLLSLATKGNQVLKFDLVVEKVGENKAVAKLPLSLTATLKDLFIFLNVNGIELTVDPRGEKVSVPLIQLEKLIDKPLAFTIDTHGHLMDAGNTFATIYKQQPALKGLSLQALLNELFFPIFALCGEELTVGSKFEKPALPDPSGILPTVVLFEITEINDQEVFATVNGTMKPKNVAFDALFNKEADTPGKIGMKLTGDMQGKVSWKRANALLYNLNNVYRYQAELRLGEMHWTVQMTISQVASGSPP